MSKIFVTSDNHFLHTNIIKYCKRPEDHNKIMIQNWNSIISENDYVIVAGDFSAGVNSYPDGMNTLKKISKNLKGQKYLIRGNHDHFDDDFYTKELGFLKVMDYMILDEFFICHFPLVINHYTKNVEQILKLIDIFNESKATKVLCGHSHSDYLQYLPNHKNVCVDLNNFTPIFLKNKD